jgi:hypothetical protein
MCSQVSWHTFVRVVHATADGHEFHEIHGERRLEFSSAADVT